MKQQYIDVYNGNREMIVGCSAPCLNVIRDAAAEAFRITGFPTQKDEAYLYCPTLKYLAADYGLNLKQIEPKVSEKELFHCSVPGINSVVVAMAGDQMRAISDTLPEGVVVCSLKEACERYPEEVELCFNSLASKHADAMTHFNNMLAQNGFFVYVKRGTCLEQPLQIVRMLDATIELMTVAHNLIFVGENAQAKLLLCDHNRKGSKVFHDTLTEVVVGNDARLELYELESTSDTTISHSQLFATQGKGSELLLNQLTLSNGITHRHTVVDLDGDHANLWLGGMVLNDRQQKTENYTEINHNASYCNSKEMFKYILDEEAEGAFSGRIIVGDGTKQTEAYQTNRNLCLTNTAKMHAKPQLEIYADDVKCGHGATTGQLDETALFYMQARGIGKEEARMLLMLAFVADVIDKITVEPLRDRLRMMTEKRLRGEGVKCSGCSLC